ncbi:hypothetical protein HJG60_011099 [Phyllostomus discolor]|uniref:Uncharacterized protein n=1 Tax=Phyllostomus discolor TaxID=89673 RepID=A0A834E1B8_9CHIR|nr:hypothetical protein HJG60_011099 [Phyllostomus discolor]
MCGMISPGWFLACPRGAWTHHSFWNAFKPRETLLEQEWDEATNWTTTPHSRPFHGPRTCLGPRPGLLCDCHCVCHTGKQSPGWRCPLVLSVSICLSERKSLQRPILCVCHNLGSLRGHPQATVYDTMARQSPRGGILLRGPLNSDLVPLDSGVCSGLWPKPGYAVVAKGQHRGGRGDPQ